MKNGQVNNGHVKNGHAKEPAPIVTNTAKHEPPITFVNPRKKPLEEITGDDIPPGLDPEDVATDYPEARWT